MTHEKGKFNDDNEKFLYFIVSKELEFEGRPMRLGEYIMGAEVESADFNLFNHRRSNLKPIIRAE